MSNPLLSGLGLTPVKLRRYELDLKNGVIKTDGPEDHDPLGFLDYVAEARAVGADRIYPHRLKVNHSYSKELSRTMLNYQRKIGIKKENDHKSFHSFRVNVITAMSNNGANTPQVMKIVGHKNGSSDEVHLGYVRDLPALKPIVDALVWPINLPCLRYDERFKEFIAKKKRIGPARNRRRNRQPRR